MMATPMSNNIRDRIFKLIIESLDIRPEPILILPPELRELRSKRKGAPKKDKRENSK